MVASRKYTPLTKFLLLQEHIVMDFIEDVCKYVEDGNSFNGDTTLSQLMCMTES